MVLVRSLSSLLLPPLGPPRVRSRAGGDSGPPRSPLAGAGSPSFIGLPGKPMLNLSLCRAGPGCPPAPQLLPWAVLGTRGCCGQLCPLPPCPQQPPGLGILTAALPPFPCPPGSLLPAVGAQVPAAFVVNDPGKVSRRLAPAPGQAWLCQAEPRVLAPLPEQDRPPSIGQGAGMCQLCLGTKPCLHSLLCWAPRVQGLFGLGR